MSDEIKAPDLESDPKAQAFLEGFVRQEVLVVLVHMPSRLSTSVHKPLSEVRAWAEKAIEGFAHAHGEVKRTDFLIVEIRKSGVVRTTTLDEWKNEPLLDKAPTA